MDFALIVASLVSFFSLVLGWVVLPHGVERGVVASAEVAPRAVSTAA